MRTGFLGAKLVTFDVTFVEFFEIFHAQKIQIISRPKIGALIEI